MRTVTAIVTTVLLWPSLAGAAPAQSTASLANQDVIGDWNLVITPSDRRDVTITVEMDEDDFPLTVRREPTGRLSCTLRGGPADCRMRNGQLVVITPGSARMIFEIAERTRNGFAGAVRLSVRFLPIGGHIGSVAMTRR